MPERTLAPGAAHLRLVYEGDQSEKETSGAFRVQSQEDGAWYAYTQFEPIGARRVFPCFDEPGFKVPWQLTLHVPAGNVAVSNTPLVGEPPQATSGTTTWRFARTQPLPSYLIALGVGPFDFLDAAPSGEKAVRTRIITPRGQPREGAYAAKVTPEILGHLERYFGIPYPYEKLDILAVPQLGGAMENAGLVTFNSELLLMRPGEEDVEQQRNLYHTQMHELSHQWLGNLVTMAWWDDLWLNEAFASWADATHRAEKAQPTWGGAVDRVSGRSYALGADSLGVGAEIRQPIESDDDILNAFDGITYGKGSAVLAMTERWLGEDVFQRGVRRHLRAHAHGNATAQDFLQALSAEAGQDVSGVLGSFLDQGGAPLVIGAAGVRGGQDARAPALSEPLLAPGLLGGCEADVARAPVRALRLGPHRFAHVHGARGRVGRAGAARGARLPHLVDAQRRGRGLLPHRPGRAGAGPTGVSPLQPPLARRARVPPRGRAGPGEGREDAGLGRAGPAPGARRGQGPSGVRGLPGAAAHACRPTSCPRRGGRIVSGLMRDTYGARARALGFTPRRPRGRGHPALAARAALARRG